MDLMFICCVNISQLLDHQKGGWWYCHCMGRLSYTRAFARFVTAKSNVGLNHIMRKKS